MLVAIVLWAFLMRKVIELKSGKFWQCALTICLLTNLEYLYVLAIAIAVLLHQGDIDITNGIIMHTTNIKKETYEMLSSVGRSLFDLRCGYNVDTFLQMMMYQVTPARRQVTDVSRGSSRLRELLNYINLPYHIENVLELGVGAGGWTQVLQEMHQVSNYIGYSRWNQEGQQPFLLKSTNPVYEFHSKNIQHVMRSRHTAREEKVLNSPTLLLSDFGENHKVSSKSSYDVVHSIYLEDVRLTLQVLDYVEEFILRRPPHFIIRVPNIVNDEVIRRLTQWQRLLGKGALIRTSDERNNVDVGYFVSLPPENLEDKAYSIAMMITERMEKCLLQPASGSSEIDGLKLHPPPVWSTIKSLPVKELLPYNMYKTIRAKGNMNPPIGTTKFLKEIGWWPSSFVGSTGTQVNSIMMYFITRLKEVMGDFNEWRTTSTKAEDTYRTVLKKIDAAPKENHKYINHLWQGYLGVSDHIRRRKMTLKRQTHEDIGAGLNRSGAIGEQENHLPYRNLGEYFDSGEWVQNVQEYKESLKQGCPIKADFNSIGKKERKKTSSSRLIWFQCATARLYEAEVLGGIDHIVKQLPYSVSGLPLYDYGEVLARIFTPDKSAIADDVAGWDTKVSFSMLCMECEFLKSLTDDQELKDEIERIYRVYAYPLVTITRKVSNQVQNVLYQLRGQVASGRRVTYSMNTITNIVVTMVRAAVSQGVPAQEIRAWVFRNMNEGHTERYGGKISGDDSAVILGPHQAKLYATIGAEFMNEIGMPRKNLPDHAPSHILKNLYDLEFCSHSYTQIAVKGGHRWMPTRSVSEILAKASIYVGNFRSKESQAAWARANALNMIVNYFHMPTIRKVAMGVLDSTPINIMLDANSYGWSYRERPWLTKGKAIDIINKCYSEHSAYPMPPVNRISDLPLANPSQLRSYEILHSSRQYVKWLWELPKYVRAVREAGLSGWKYDNVGTQSFDADLLTKFKKPFNWGGLDKGQNDWDLGLSAAISFFSKKTT